MKLGQLYDFDAVMVPVVELLHVIRACDADQKIVVVHIFDFY